jgi:DNA polymerase-4
VARAIALVRIAAFAVSLERRDRPDLRGRSIVVIDGEPGDQEVVCADGAAAQAGVVAGQPVLRARQLAPDAHFVTQNADRRRAEWSNVLALIARHASAIEDIAPGDAYADFRIAGGSVAGVGQKAAAMRDDLSRGAGLTALVAVAPNKLLARIVADSAPEPAVVVLSAGRVAEFLESLPISRLPGLGADLLRRLTAAGVDTVAQLRQWNEAELGMRFGADGGFLYRLARGIDERPVRMERDRKFISAEESFPAPVTDRTLLRGHLARITERAVDRLLRNDLRARVVTVKVRNAELNEVTRSRTLLVALDDADALVRCALMLMREALRGRPAVSRLGVVLAVSDTWRAEAEAQGTLPWSEAFD